MRPCALILSSCVALGLEACGGISGLNSASSSMFVRAVLPLQSPECVAKADPSSTERLEGTLDLAFRTNYQAVLLVGNRSEISSITVRGAIVTDRHAEGKQLESYSVVAPGYLDPAFSGTTPSYEVVEVELIPDEVGNHLRSTLVSNTRVIADVQVYGDTLDGRSIKSADLLFPIQVCFGCLVEFPPDALDPKTPNRCVGTTTYSPPCLMGQDDPIDCRLCVGNPACTPPKT
jgi:hypothetical protein